ncbi:hypothetical protein L5515_015334 [Caenorhabditis briggsae]|uniref:Uncharacterized protein n=1 Tax=Caenorhabditis briggsae TaxID=6238 RepID=A0AAE9EBJ6_CAEBR|nr:hypothetical protein L5515_015334 [Caenorhabditis briggsae]
MLAIMSAQMEWLVYCFMKKHQILAKIMSWHVCPEKLFNLGQMAIPVLPVFVYVVFCKAGMPRDQQMDYVREINGALTDFHTTILVQPFPLTPMVCGHYKGIWGSFSDAFPYWQVAFSITSIITQVEALIFCFYRKHQTIAMVMNGVVCSKSFTFAIRLMALVTPLWIFYALIQAGMTRDEQLDYVKKNYPEYLTQFSKVTNVALFTLNIWLEAVCITSAVGGFTSSFAFSATTFDLFRMLKSMRKRVSAYNYKRHKAAVHSLFAQFIASTVLLIPPFIYMIVSIGYYGNAQFAIQIILAVFSLRSSVNSIVLIVTTPPYRKFVLRIKPRPNSVAVSSSGHSNQQLNR